MLAINKNEPNFPCTQAGTWPVVVLTAARLNSPLPDFAPRGTVSLNPRTILKAAKKHLSPPRRLNLKGIPFVKRTNAAAAAYPVTLPDKVVLGENSAAMRFSLSADSHEAVPMGKRMQGTVGRAARTAPRGWVRPASSRKTTIPRSSCSMTATAAGL